MLKSLMNQFLLDNDTVRRLGDLLSVATEQGDTGVIAFVDRAVSYAVNGKLRARDIDTLNTLERTYNRDYYQHRVHVEQHGDCFLLV